MYSIFALINLANFSLQTKFLLAIRLTITKLGNSPLLQNEAVPKRTKFQVHKNNCIQRYQEPEGCCRWLITDFDSCWATSVMIRQVEEWRQFSRLFCPQKDNWKAFMWNKGSIGLVPVFDLCEMLRGGVTGLTFDMTWSIIKFRTSKTEYVHTVTQIYGVLFKIPS